MARMTVDDVFILSHDVGAASAAMAGVLRTSELKAARPLGRAAHQPNDGPRHSTKERPMANEFLTTTEVARRCGVARSAPPRWCATHPGFGLFVANRWRVPAAHVDRMLSGESVESIARSPSISASVNVDAAIEAAQGRETPCADSDEEVLVISASASISARDRIIRSFIFAKALHLHADLAIDRRLAVLTQLSDELLDALKDLGLMQGELREMILQTDACAAYRRISGFPVEV